MTDLNIRDVHKRFGETDVIKGVDLTIPDGAFTVFVGPSGCGKSTLLRLIAGLEDVTSGEIRLGDRRVNEATPAERGVAMVFQSYALYPHLTVRKNLSFGLENLKTPRAEIDRRVADAARMLAIDAYLNRKPKALSGGQRQRVAIGRAIVRNPTLFLFDEPLSNLDAHLRVQMRNEICELHRKLKTTMIYVTHDQVEAMVMAEQIVVLRDGCVEQVGDPLTLFERPANKFVAGFIGSPQMNFFTATLQSKGPQTVDVFIAGLGNLTIPADASALDLGAEVTVGIRPSDLSVTGAGGFSFHVHRVECLGHETYIHGQFGAADHECILHVTAHMAARPGDRLSVEWPSERVHVFDARTGLAMTRHTPTVAA